MLLRYIWKIFPALLFACSTASAVEAGVASVQLRIVGLKSMAGSVNIAIFDGSQGFPGSPDKALKRLTQPITDIGNVVVTLPLAPGTYSFAVFHDENADQKLNKNMFGMPSEGVGFSKDPKIRLGPPKFEECAVLVAGDTTVTITIHN